MTDAVDGLLPYIPPSDALAALLEQMRHDGAVAIRISLSDAGLFLVQPISHREFYFDP